MPSIESQWCLLESPPNLGTILPPLKSLFFARVTARPLPIKVIAARPTDSPPLAPGNSESTFSAIACEAAIAVSRQSAGRQDYSSTVEERQSAAAAAARRVARFEKCLVGWSQLDSWPSSLRGKATTDNFGAQETQTHTLTDIGNPLTDPIGDS